MSMSDMTPQIPSLDGLDLTVLRTRLNEAEDALWKLEPNLDPVLARALQARIDRARGKLELLAQWTAPDSPGDVPPLWRILSDHDRRVAQLGFPGTDRRREPGDRPA